MLRLRPHQAEWRRVDDEVVALNLGTSMYLSANSSGRILWERLAEGTTRDELVDTLVDAFGIARDRASGDVDAFLTELREQDLLEE